MSNVLPSKYRAAVVSRLRARFFLVGSLVLVAGALIAILALLPSVIFVHAARAAVGTPEAARIAAEDQDAARRAQDLITLVGPLVATSSSPAEALVEALAVKPAGVVVDLITYANETSSLTLSGVSSRREAVSEYRDALEHTGRFSGVAVPIAALVGARDGTFTMTLTGYR